MEERGKAYLAAMSPEYLGKYKHGVLNSYQHGVPGSNEHGVLRTKITGSALDGVGWGGVGRECLGIDESPDGGMMRSFRWCRNDLVRLGLG